MPRTGASGGASKEEVWLTTAHSKGCDSPAGEGSGGNEWEAGR